MLSFAIHLLSILVASSLCSLLEAAFLSLPLIRAKILREQNRHGAKDLLYVKENIMTTIAMIVIFNNTINIVGSIYIGQEVVERFGSQWLGWASAALTIILIVFTEIIPKTIGEHYKVPVSLLFAKPVRALLFIFKPLVMFIINFTRLVSPDTSATRVTEDEIKMMLRLGRDEGTVEFDEEVLINRVFKLNDVRAFQIMKPIEEIFSLPADKTLEELKEQIVDCRFSRIVVYDKSPHQIIGVVRQQTLLAEMVKNNYSAKVREFVILPIFINGMVPADKLLERFQSSQQHLFIVEDAKKKHIGVVTMEDVLEELFGEIFDEKDTLRQKAAKK